tara:strand:- start:8706 stop:8978 length:273 start_codon:yes stop_codon:yes gene_type:complete
MIPFGHFVKEGDCLLWEIIHGVRSVGWTIELVEEFVIDPYVGYKGLVLNQSDSLKTYYFCSTGIQRSFLNGQTHPGVSILTDTEKFIYSL